MKRFIAIYLERDDGDFDFVACFDREQLPEPPSNWPVKIQLWYESVGETIKMVELDDLSDLTDILEK